MVNRYLSYTTGYGYIGGTPMQIAGTEKELASKAARFLKAEMKRAGVTYAELARRMGEHGLQETEASITSKLARGTFSAVFMLAVLAALDVADMRLADL